MLETIQLHFEKLKLQRTKEAQLSEFRIIYTHYICVYILYIYIIYIYTHTLQKYRGQASNEIKVLGRFWIIQTESLNHQALSNVSLASFL